MYSENKKSRDSTTTGTTSNAIINVSQIVDSANENVTKLVNESSKVQPQYAQAISNLQQEYIDALRNAIHRAFSVQKQLVTSNSNFNNFTVPEAAAPYVQGLVKQSEDITNNFISVADTNNQLTINALNVLRENVKNFSRTVEAAAEYNSNLARSWASSIPSFQQQFASSR
jgi:archaellum component FlaC